MQLRSFVAPGLAKCPAETRGVAAGPAIAGARRVYRPGTSAFANVGVNKPA